MTKENFRENLFIDFNIRISTSCVITSLASIMKQSTSNYVSGISTLSEIKSRLHLHTVSSRLPYIYNFSQFQFARNIVEKARIFHSEFRRFSIPVSGKRNGWPYARLGVFEELQPYMLI